MTTFNGNNGNNDANKKGSVDRAALSEITFPTQAEYKTSASLPEGFRIFTAEEVGHVRAIVHRFMVDGTSDDCALAIDHDDKPDDFTGTALVIEMTGFRVYVRVYDWAPQLRISVADMYAVADAIFQGTWTIDCVSEDLATRSGARTLLTSPNVSEYAKDMHAESDAIADHMCALQDLCSDPRNWRGAIPRGALMTGKVWPLVEGAAV